MAQLTSRAPTRPHLRGDIDELEAITRENWSNASVLFEVFVELGYRRQRKRKRQLKDKIYKRLIEIAGYFVYPITNAPGGDRRLSGALWPEKVCSPILATTWANGDCRQPSGERFAILSI